MEKIEMDDLLDSLDFYKVKALSDFQLIGFLEEKTVIASYLTESINEEIKQRALTDQEIVTFKEKYNSTPLLSKIDLGFSKMKIAFISLLVLISVLLSPISLISFIISFLAIRVKLSKGVKRQRKFWIISYGLILVPVVFWIFYARLFLN